MKSSTRPNLRFGRVDGAANRSRTGTDVTPADFKSALSTYSNIAAWEAGCGGRGKTSSRDRGKRRSFRRSIWEKTKIAFQKTQEKSGFFEGETSNGTQHFKSALSTYSNTAACGSIVARFSCRVKGKWREVRDLARRRRGIIDNVQCTIDN